MYALGLRAYLTGILFVSMPQIILYITHLTAMAKYYDFACYTSSYSDN